MSIETSSQTIQAIWECLTQGASGARLKKPLARWLSDAATKDGWVCGSHVDDLLYDLDLRVKEEEMLSLAGVAKEPVFYRPGRREHQVMGSSHLRVASFAALLIFLERLGLPVDPQPLVQRLRPGLKRGPRLLTSDELHVLWYDQERHKFEITLQAAETDALPGKHATLTTVTGYKVWLFSDATGQATRLSVEGSHWRPRRPRRKLAPGTWVRIQRPYGFGSRIGAIVKDDGGGVTVACDWSPGALLTRDQIAVCRDQADRLPPMRSRLPYGQWTCPDGREVLFNRDYRAVWQRRPSQAAEPADVEEWVNFEDEEWFFDDGNSPWQSRRTAERCEEILRDFGATPAPLVDGRGFIAAYRDTLRFPMSLRVA
jgi:hypothetical protein